MAPALLTRSQFAKIRPQGNYTRYTNYVTQKRAQRAARPGAWTDPPQVRGKVGPNVTLTAEGLFAPGDPGVPGEAVDPTGLDPNDPGAPAPGAGVGVTPAPTTRHVPGHFTNPDYEALLRGDPRFIAGQTALTTAKGSAATKRANLIKNAIIAFGGVPKDWVSGYGDLNETDLAKAAENPYSFMALANAQRGRSGADLMAELAGRGMLNSGALTGGQNMVQSDYDKGVAGGTGNLLTALGGYGSDYATTIGGLDQDWINTQATIGAGIQAGNPNEWIPDYEEPI